MEGDQSSQPGLLECASDCPSILFGHAPEDLMVQVLSRGALDQEIEEKTARNWARVILFVLLHV